MKCDMTCVLMSFINQGFLVKKDFFSKEELQEAIDGVNEKVESLAASLFEAGKIRGTGVNTSFMSYCIVLLLLVIKIYSSRSAGSTSSM